jgi:hypothetical protein
MFTIPRHDGNRNGMASAAQRHTSHPPTTKSTCAAAVLNPGDHSAGPCMLEVGFILNVFIVFTVYL